MGGSFRDPSGHVFRRDGRLFRQVNQRYAADYDRLVASGLYRTLTGRGLLVAHEEVAEAPDDEGSYRVLAPEVIPFISYPFEWAFSQLKAAALATLAIQRQAVEHGMVLKDASAYNIQFVGAAPVFIDTLSFEQWVEGTPWVAYRQFCQHFLGPLALMSATDIRLGALSRLFIDGPPLDLVSQLLPATTKLHPSLLVHLHLHARAQARHGGAAIAGRTPTGFTKRSMLGLVEHLESAVQKLVYKAAGTTWADYYAHTNYSDAAMAEKHRLVARMIEASRPATVWDLGANTGAFSVLSARAGAYTLALDFDPAAVERAVRAGQAHDERRILPLVMDLANPSGAMGWAHEERHSLVERGPADLVLALGLIHHLSLSNHVPFGMTADFFARIGRALVIEFVPPTDSQVLAMLSRMPRAQEGYTQLAFETAYRQRFEVVASARIAGTERTLYQMAPREPRW
ncbi:MAG TPA: class I SAM-dependent methyltransferase [Vicinamibacterales bacterium]|nr:class I SAM-dependent methyltransferase [Vicinamibacterales bacterium]